MERVKEMGLDSFVEIGLEGMGMDFALSLSLTLLELSQALLHLHHSLNHLILSIVSTLSISFLDTWRFSRIFLKKKLNYK